MTDTRASSDRAWYWTILSAIATVSAIFADDNRVVGAAWVGAHAIGASMLGYDPMYGAFFGFMLVWAMDVLE